MTGRDLRRRSKAWRRRTGQAVQRRALVDPGYPATWPTDLGTSIGWGSLPQSDLPDEVMPRLERVRAHTLASLPALTSRTGVVALSAELWSARKVLRRTLWHERDHTDHILKLRAVLR
jgi:hypothetical protein